MIGMERKVRRNRYIIIYQILKTLSERSMSKAELARELNVVYYSLIKYLEHLEKKGLVKQEYTKYVITDEGKKVMKEIEPLVNQLMIEKELAKKLDI